MPLSTADKIGIGQIGLSGLTGLFGGLNNSGDKDRATNEQRYADARDDEFFQLLLQALGNQSNVEQDVTAENLQRSLAFANANPLGAEQGLRTKGAAGIAGLDLLQNRKLGGGQVNNAANVNTGELRNTLSPQAAEESIRQRRIATAGLDPRAQMEVGGAGSDYASRLFGDLQQSQNQRRDNAQSAYNMVGDRRAQIAQVPVTQPEQKKNEPGFWKKLGGAVLPVAGLAANFIPGVGPLAGMALGAAGGAAGGALLGGKKGALAGAGLGTAGAAAMNQLPSQQPQKSFNNGMTRQSMPGPMRSGSGQLQIPSVPTNMGLPNSVQQNKPGLMPSTLASPNAPQVKPTMPFNMTPAVSHTNQAPIPIMAQPQGVPQMRSATTSERFSDALSPLTNFLSALGMPGVSSRELPLSASPLAQGQPNAISQVLQTPMGAGMLAGIGGGGTPIGGVPRGFTPTVARNLAKATPQDRASALSHLNPEELQKFLQFIKANSGTSAVKLGMPQQFNPRIGAGLGLGDQ